jgi:hypothetical protein
MDENHLLHNVVRRDESVTITADDLTLGNHVYLVSRTKDTVMALSQLILIV